MVRDDLRIGRLPAVFLAEGRVRVMRLSNISQLTAAIVIVGAGLCLGGCQSSGQAVEGDAIEIDAVSGGGLCVPLQPDRTSTVGDRRLVVDDEQAEITAVDLVGANGVQLIETMLVPYVDEGTPIYVETGASYPPSDKHLTPAWALRQEATEAPLEAGSEWGMTLGLRVSDEGGSIDGLRVTYTANGRAQFVSLDAPVEIREKC